MNKVVSNDYGSVTASLLPIHFRDLVFGGVDGIIDYMGRYSFLAQLPKVHNIVFSHIITSYM